MNEKRPPHKSFFFPKSEKPIFFPVENPQPGQPKSIRLLNFEQEQAWRKFLEYMGYGNDKRFL